MRVKRADQLFDQMVEGRVYRREELVVHSRAVDRELHGLVKSSRVVKAAAGLYYRPSCSRFGARPAEPKDVVRAFLKSNEFLLTSLNYFNGLGVGLTQLTNESIVYNRKRIGKFKLDGMNYDFQRPLNFPKPSEANEEYLFVDLLNNYENVYEPPDFFDGALKRKASRLRKDELLKAAALYAKASAYKRLMELLRHG